MSQASGMIKTTSLSDYVRMFFFFSFTGLMVPLLEPRKRERIPVPNTAVIKMDVMVMTAISVFFH